MAKTKTTPRKRPLCKPYEKKGFNVRTKQAIVDLTEDDECKSHETKSKKDVGTQTDHIVGSYKRRELGRSNDIMTYEQFRCTILTDHGSLFQWCLDHNLIASKRVCFDCGQDMKLKSTKEGRGDKWVWRCRRRIGEGKEHFKETSIRQDSIFEGSNLTIGEILQFIYWWSAGLTQNQIKIQMRLSQPTVCNWHAKCREVCEYLVMKHPRKIGGKMIICYF